MGLLYIDDDQSTERRERRHGNTQLYTRGKNTYVSSQPLHPCAAISEKLPKSRKFPTLESFGQIPEKLGKLPEKSEEVSVNSPKRHANRGRSASRPRSTRPRSSPTPNLRPSCTPSAHVALNLRGSHSPPRPLALHLSPQPAAAAPILRPAWEKRARTNLSGGRTKFGHACTTNLVSAK